MHLIRDLLDKPLLDHDHEPMGRVDGIVLVLRKDAAPRVARLESGPLVLARRIGPRAEKLARRLCAIETLGIPWTKVLSAGKKIWVDVDSDHTPAGVWKQRTAAWMARIPGARR